jgi:hypothetical protein
MDLGSLLVAAAAFVLSILSFYFSINSWRESNRPIVTARVTSFDPGGEKGTALNIVVENTGNRPAKNVRLSVKAEDLKAALVENLDDTWQRTMTRIFSDRGVIAVLGNGKNVSNDFGWLAGGDPQSTWKDECRFNVEISYEDLDGRKFQHINPLFVAGDEGFAGTSWENPKMK